MSQGDVYSGTGRQTNLQTNLQTAKQLNTITNRYREQWNMCRYVSRIIIIRMVIARSTCRGP